MKKLLVFLLCMPLAALAQTQTITYDFEAPSAQWTEKDDGNTSQAFRNGAMIYDAYQQGYMNKTAVSQLIDFKSDYSLEMKLKFILGMRKDGYGITWGFRSWNNYMLFYVTNEGFAGILGKRNGQDITLMGPTEIKAKILKRETEYNVLRVEKKGNDVFFLINGTQVFQTTADQINCNGSSQGLMVRNNMKIGIDYFTITCREQKINLVDHPENGFKLENMGSLINTSSSERGPLIAPDGKTLYFVSDRQEGLGGTDIWQTVYADNAWSQAYNPGKPLNNSGHNFVISVTPDGNTMLLGNTYNEDGSPRSSGVSISVKRNGEWSVPVEQKINSYVNNNDYCNFFLTPDGTRLIMSIENDECMGEKDLFISFLNSDNTWSKPQHMGKNINSQGGDYSPFLATDGKTLFFASDGHPGYGSSDVFVSKRLDDTWLNWSEPKNLGPEINTAGWEAYYCMAAQGNYAYMVATDKADGKGSDDLYRIKVGEDIMPDPVVMVKGRVYNKKTNELIEAEILYNSLEDQANTGRAFSTLKDGFVIALPKGAWYGFQARAAGFVPVSENIDLKNLESYAEKEVNLYLVPIEKGQVVRLNNIFFDFSKASLRAESNSELERLIQLLNENPDMKIEIGGHTDDKGSDAFNLQLSNDRARAVADYLMSKGIARERVSYKGYGETKPVADNGTDEGAQLNRRVEFLIR